RAVVDGLVPPAADEPPGAVADPPGSPAPPWLAELGTARPTGTYAYGDVYGDQVNYLATFACPEETLGGPDHVISILIDRNLDMVKDLFIATPAAVVIERLRDSAAEDETTFFAERPPESMLAALPPYLASTDASSELPGSESFGTDRAIVLARLRLLAAIDVPEAGPESPPEAEPTTLPDPEYLAAFRQSPEADRLVGAPGDAAALTFCLELIGRHAAARHDRDVLRWSPAAVRRFLLDWVPGHAILDAADRALLPSVLDAWVRWAGRVQRLPPRLVAVTITTIAQVRRGFLHRVLSGTLRSPAAEAVARLLADGIDLDDEAAVARWLDAYNAERDDPGCPTPNR
ncbi:MAG: hypothetical protein HKP61_00150, partial [Dactylosporangium sp.]|nr:hypothetical protein [Dactylosporangium sp.]NNJ59383.1 hypothetical protein [Dactylosporangium sp.]